MNGSPQSSSLSPQEAQALVLDHLPKIRSEARRFLSKRHDLTLDDLFQSGVEGALVAAEKFDPEKNYKFFTYAVYWVRRYIQAAIMDGGSRIRLPAHVHSNAHRLRVCQHELGRRADTEELKEMSGISEMTIENTLRAKRMRIISLHRKVNPADPDSATLEDTIPDTEVPPSDVRSENEEEEARLQEALDHLDHRDPVAASILRLHYGLSNDNALTMAQIGEQMNLSRERIRQIKDRGEKRLAKIYRQNA